jgi:peptide/nickel transport system substrate-binding protein
MSLAVLLQPDARWHDGQRVLSDDIIYSFSIYTGKALGSPMASQLSAIDSVTRVDSSTVKFWFNKRYPLQFYDATSQMQILPKHIFGKIPLDSLRAAASRIDPIGSGRYRFVSRKRGESIVLESDTANYRGAPKIGRLVWRFFQSQPAAANALLAGEVDVFDVIRPANVKEIASNNSLHVLVSPGADYAFMAFNFKDPNNHRKPHRLFVSRELRQALTMAVNRVSMTRNLFDSLATLSIGPTISSFVPRETELHQIPYDPPGAGRILDSLGWRKNSNTGMRERNGIPLRFTVLVPANSTAKKNIAVLIQEELRKVGVAVDFDIMDPGAFSDRLQRRDFDGALLSWHLGTSPASIREIWTSEAASEHGINYGSYANPAADAYVDSAVSAMNAAQRDAYYSRAYQTMIDDAAALWLYEARLVLGIHKRIRTKPYRPDAWWFSLGDWEIPGGEEIPRDRLQ